MEASHAVDGQQTNQARYLPYFLCALWLLIGIAPRALATAPSDGSELWVEVMINMEPRADIALVRVDRSGALFARDADVKDWGLLLPQPPPTAPDGTPHLDDRQHLDDLPHLRIDNIPGLRVALDPGRTRLSIDADPALFHSQLISRARRTASPDSGVPALFADYDLFGERASGGTGGYSGHFEVGASLGRASLVNNWIATYLTGVDRSQIATPLPPAWSRLDTALLIDLPERTARLTIGDSITPPGTLGQSVRFSGVHWATDFATQPGITPYSLPAVSGTAAVPSSVELYVNHSLLSRSTLDPGPFQLQNIPVPVGQGDVNLRVRDAAGRDQFLSIPYLVSPQLIAPGLTLTDFAVGSVRKNYGLASFDYGEPFFTAAFRHGQTPSWTYTGSAEILQDQFTTRAGAALRLGSNIVFDVTPAVSHRPGADGTAIDVGAQSLLRFADFGVHLRAASREFAELGSDAVSTRLHTEWAAQASTQISRLGSFAIIYGRRSAYNATTTVATTVTYNASVRQLGAFSVFVSRTQGAVNDCVAGINFTHFLGSRTSASGGVTHVSGATTYDARVSMAAPPDSGWGWDVARSQGALERSGLRVISRSEYGVASGELDSIQGSKMGSLAWQGGFLWTGGRPWLGQSLSGPATLVELPELAGVRIMHDGQPAGRTDSDGRLLIVSLRPFEDNTITLVNEDLPLTAIVPTDALVVRPYTHGVTQAHFPVTAAASETVVLRLNAAEVVPAGAQLTLGSNHFIVGQRGLVQIPRLKRATEAEVTWPSGKCHARLTSSRRTSVPETALCVRAN